jgi:hypothetical protein
MLSGKFPARGDRGVTHRDTPDRAALTLNLLASLAPDRPGNARTQNQIVVRGVHDRVGVHLRQVTLLDNDFFPKFLRTKPAHFTSLKNQS